MTLQIFALLLVVVGFVCLSVWVYWPTRKSYWQALSHIPLQDDVFDKPATTAPNPRIEK